MASFNVFIHWLNSLTGARSWTSFSAATGSCSHRHGVGKYGLGNTKSRGNVGALGNAASGFLAAAVKGNLERILILMVAYFITVPGCVGEIGRVGSIGVGEIGGVGVGEIGRVGVGEIG